MSPFSIPSLKRAVRRDRAEPAVHFETIYQDHFRFVWSTLLRLGTPRHAIEDACQETFLVVHRRLCDFEPHGNPRAWLFGIARRVASRVRRSQDRTKRKISALRRERPAEPRVDDAVAQRQLSALLLDALDELDDDKRAALTLHVFEEMSGPQVAEALGLKVDTVYSRIKAGRKALKRALEGRGVDGDVAQLVRATREQTEPRAGMRRRVGAMLVAPLGAPSPPGLAGLTWKSLLLVVAAPIVIAGGIRVLRSPDVRGPAVNAQALPEPRDESKERASVGTDSVSTDLREALVTRPQLAPAATKAAPAHPRPRGSTPNAQPGPAAAPPQHPVGLRAEVDLIERATTTLRAGNPDHAIAILGEHARRFPTGQLAAERRAYRAVALCTAGNTQQGRAEAQLARASKPSKALVAWLDTACGDAAPTPR